MRERGNRKEIVCDTHKLKQVKPGSVDGVSVMRRRLTGAGS